MYNIRTFHPSLCYSGHSRTVIGIEEGEKEVVLLILDPSHNQEEVHRVLMDTKNCVRLLKKTLDQLKQEEYEIVFIKGLLKQESYEVSIDTACPSYISFFRCILAA